MHRIKVGLFAAAVLVAITGVAYVAVTGNIKDTVTEQVSADVSRAQRLLQQTARLEATDFAGMAATFARRPSVVAVFDRTDAKERREEAFKECEGLNAALESASRKADIVAIIEKVQEGDTFRGPVLARDLNINAMHGEDLRPGHPAVEQALQKGVSAMDVWNLGGRMHRVAVAPIVGPDGAVRGAILLGYVFTVKDAQAKRDVLGSDVGYFQAGKVQASSFVSGKGDDAKEDGGRSQALNAKLFDGKMVQGALEKGAATEPFHLAIEGHDFVAIAAPLPSSTDKTSGIVVLKSIDESMSSFSKVGPYILLLGALAVLVAILAAVFTALRFIKPLDKVELGVADIINGNIDYTFKPVGPDFEGLSNALNVMIARMLGRDEPSEDAVEEEEEAAAKWRSEHMVIDEATSVTPASDGAAATLAAENETAHANRLFGEYAAALKAKDAPVGGLTLQVFTAKLRLAEGQMKKKLQCRMVRFQVVVAGDQVSLKSIAIA